MTDILERVHRLRLLYSQSFGDWISLIFPMESGEWEHRLGPLEGTSFWAETESSALSTAYHRILSLNPPNPKKQRVTYS